MDKINVLLLSIHYPFAIKHYFENAFRRMPNIDLRTTGPYTANWSPWMGGMTLPLKYAVPPTYPLPFKPDVGRVPYDFVKAQIKDDWVPDLVITINAGINWTAKPSDGIVVSVGTDSHCLDYSHDRVISDKFFNMHPFYAQKGDIHLPYAFDASVMYATSNEKDADAVLIGMPYPQRIQWVSELRQRGLKVLFENGPIFDEYRELNNRAVIGLNWASLQDLNCRVFELMAMKLVPVINKVPDLDLLGFVDGEHYLGFNAHADAVERVMWAKEHPEEAQAIALAAHEKVHREDHTFDRRVRTILKECDLS